MLTHGGEYGIPSLTERIIHMKYTTVSPNVTIENNNRIPILLSDGRVIGKVQNGIFKKRISGSKHFLRKPPAIAFSVENLTQAEQAGAIKIEVTDKDNGCVYFCTLEHFKRYSWELQRGGFERQRALALSRWDVAGGKNSTPKTIPTVEPALEYINQPVQLALL
jgi:hypothetical protein